MMKLRLRFFILPAIFCISFFQLSAQNHYSNFQTMSQNLEALSKEFPALCTIKSLVKTTGGKDIWVLTIGAGNKDSKPGIAVFGGVEGSHILGKELAAGFASSILKGICIKGS